MLPVLILSKANVVHCSLMVAVFSLKAVLWHVTCCNLTCVLLSF